MFQRVIYSLYGITSMFQRVIYSLYGITSMFQVKSLCFDHSGTYLAIAGTDVRYVPKLGISVPPPFRKTI